MNQPESNEYAPFYANYIKIATAQGDVIPLLHRLKTDTYQVFKNLPVNKENYAYAEGKWTVKELLGHMIDTERIFAYRLLCLSRGEQKALPGFEQNDYVNNAAFKTRTLESLADEFRVVREANLYLIDSLTEDQIAGKGVVSGNTITARAILYIMAGHELHHLQVLKERYL